MAKKWCYQWGLPTPMLIAILCFTHYAVAAPLKTEAARKGKPGATAKSAKSHSATSATVRPQTKTLKPGKQEQSQIRKKRALATAHLSAPTKSRKSASPSRLRASASLRESSSSTKSRKSTLAAAKLTKRHQARRADSKHKSRVRSAKGIRVLALKESKDRKYAKMKVTTPASRTTPARTTRRSASPKIVPTPDSFASQHLSAVTEAARHPTMSAIPPAEQLPSTPDTALRAPVALPREPGVPAETALAALKEPELGEAIKPERHQSSAGYAPERAAFHVKFNGAQLLHRLNSAFVLPGDEIFVEVVDAQRKHDYMFRTTLGKERQLGPTRWYWNAPASPGVYPVKVQRTRSHTTVTLNVFVMVPLDRVEDGVLNGYRIGQYPRVALRQEAIYTPPRGLIEVTADNENMLVSPHFRLRQFLCKQDGNYPKYMILDRRLLNVLELLLEKANAQGYRARTLTVMSGYRTPYYNRAIGNSTTYSRHVWGDAADIFIDENPQDGYMDDLNQDGMVDAHDAEVMYDLIENEYDSRFQKLLVGGLARYRETSAHGPFVHVDVRGVEARWGARRTAPSPLPVALSSGGSSRRLQPSYWEEEGKADSTP